MNNYAIILAAGIGSRLYPLTQEYPKSLIKVDGREILDYQIQGYIKSGIKEENIYIVTGYKHEMIVDYLKSHYSKVNEIYSPDYLVTNNMYSLYLGLNALKDKFENILHLFINNADCLYDENLMEEFVNSKYESAIAVEVGTYNEESMKVVTRNDNSLVNISKSISKEDAYGVSIDLYKYSKKSVINLLEIINDYIEVKKDLKQWTEVAFPQLFKKEKIYPYDIKNKNWVEVDNNEDLLLADKLFSKIDLRKKKVIISDLDGTLYVGSKPIENAIKYIQDTNFDCYFFTNNTSKTPDDYINKLNNLGINCKNENILTPLYPLINYLEEKQYKSVYLVSTQKVKDYFVTKLPNINFEYDKKNNKAVILTYDTEIDYSKLCNICYLLQNKEIEYLATHQDVFCPSENGNIPDIGSFIKLLKTTTYRTPDKTFGKPSTKLVEQLLKKYKTEQIFVVGDRLYTDKALADNIGCDFICVLSGETQRLDIQNYKDKYPSLVVKDISEISYLADNSKTQMVVERERVISLIAYKRIKCQKVA